ncbi:MAG: MBL fold metallo-hydrolase [Oscillospiraceae bacterium]|nr:MBL fold metallo-hydrolase [Oscillospiraceae bacterium]
MKISASSITNTNLAEGQVGIWYLGQEGFLFKNKDKYLVVDPYLSYYVDENCCQFVKWERLYAPPISAEELSFVDVVVCTHSHFDHADPSTLSKIAKANPKTVFVVPAPEKETIAAYGIESERIISAKADEILSICGFEIKGVPSAHEEFHIDKNGNYHELGYIIEADGQRFFHAGDMCIYDGLAERLTNIDIAFLPINGRDYYRNKNDIIGNFDCVEAVTLAKEIGAKMLVPMHHDLYAVNKVESAYFVSVLNEIHPYRQFHIFSPAERYISVK